jgi:hypothetical protein
MTAASRFPAFLRLALAAALAASPAAAQGGPGSIARGVQSGYLTGRLESPVCPKSVTASYAVAYPKGTGSPLADLMILNFARLLEGAFIADVVNPVMGEKESCEKGFEITGETSFATASPSAGHLSVVFTEEGYAGGAHGYRKTRVLNLQGGGSVMDMYSLFPEGVSHLPWYWSIVHGLTCAAGKGTMPALYGGAPCGGDQTPSPEAFMESAGTLAALGNLPSRRKGRP